MLVAAHTRIPYWQEAFAGLRRAGAEMHVKVDMVGPARYDPKAEREAFQGVIADKPSGILISPADPTLMAADIDSALQQGIRKCRKQQDESANECRVLGLGSYAERAIHKVDLAGNITLL
ncbi:MAG: substrate-binding domain-containing protein [Acidobacteria bacterium]|nr:substrate-binding domain-containing protein [Acidobacteriota bacterium]